MEHRLGCWANCLEESHVAIILLGLLLVWISCFEVLG